MKGSNPPGALSLALRSRILRTLYGHSAPERRPRISRPAALQAAARSQSEWPAEEFTGIRAPSRLRAECPRSAAAPLRCTVSQICKLRSAQRSGPSRQIERSAEYNSAIRQIENLRYGKHIHGRGEGGQRPGLRHAEAATAAHQAAAKALMLSISKRRRSRS